MSISLLVVSVIAYTHRAKIKDTVSKTLYNLKQGGPSVIIHHSTVNNSEMESQHKEPYQQVNYSTTASPPTQNNSGNNNNNTGNNMDDLDLFM
jgi:hypothetical protein